MHTVGFPKIRDTILVGFSGSILGTLLFINSHIHIYIYICILLLVVLTV